MADQTKIFTPAFEELEKVVARIRSLIGKAEQLEASESYRRREATFIKFAGGNGYTTPSAESERLAKRALEYVHNLAAEESAARTAAAKVSISAELAGLRSHLTPLVTPAVIELATISRQIKGG